MAKDTQIKLHLKNVRLSFPHLFQPSAMEEDQKKSFSCHLLIPANDPQVKAVQKAMQDTALGKYGQNGAAIFKELWQAGRVAMRKGDTKRNSDGDVMEGYAGNYFLSARSYTRPTVIDRDRTPLQEGDGKPYGGCYVNAIVAFWAQTGQFGKRINCQLQGIQFVKDGDSFGGGRAASADEFDSLADEFDGADADAFDDDIPF